MPISLSFKKHINSKSLKLSALFILSPIFFYAQSLTGLWTGSLSNDSTTVRKDQSYEIALTEYKGKVYGYSRSEFIVNDTLYYIMKRVKGTIEGDVCEVKDDEIIAYNFRGKLDKGIKVTSTFRRNQNDSTWYLDGTWKTNATKKYYAVSGKVDLAVEKDLTASKIFPHLEELKLADKVAFYKEREIGEPIVKIAKPEKIKTEYIIKSEDLSIDGADIAIATKPTFRQATVKVVEPKSEEIIAAVPKQDPPIKKEQPIITPEIKEVKTTAVVKTQPVISKQTETKPVVQPKQQDVVKTTPVKTNNTTVSNTVTVKKDIVKEITPPVVITETKKSEPVVKLNVDVIEGRKSEFSQVVNFKSDSLLISLYDNGEIDGDTVSVLMNGEMIMAKQGLKASAIKKTIYIPAGNEEFTLVMFAETLGKYPPNTGLLVIHDGEDVYNLRFSSDFQKNAGIVFRRKKN